MNKAKVELIEYAKLPRNTKRFTYLMENDNGNAIARQTLVLEKTERGWTAKLCLATHAEEESASAAAFGLADTLEIAIQSMRIGEYFDVPDVDFKPVKQQKEKGNES